MIISHKSWVTFKECPHKYYLTYIKKEKPLKQENDYHKLYGLLVQKFFELFCNLWRFKTPHLFPEVINERLLILWEKMLSTVNVEWPARKTGQELFDRAFRDICTIMGSVEQNYFLNSKAEVTVQVKLKDSHILMGRIDFIHTDYLSGNSTVIFDGKGTDTIGKNVNKEQLYFYALLYYLETKVLPATLGFFYYRHNTFIPIFFNLEVLNEFRAQLSLDIKKMTSCDILNPTPSAKACKYCIYIGLCKEGLESKAKRSKQSKIDIQCEGISEFSF